MVELYADINILPLAVAFSPSGCARHCIAVGDTQIGNSTCCPSIVVLRSVLETSANTLGRMTYLRGS